MVHGKKLVQNFENTPACVAFDFAVGMSHDESMRMSVGDVAHTPQELKKRVCLSFLF
jgi:hypothetical protein